MNRWLRKCLPNLTTTEAGELINEIIKMLYDNGFLAIQDVNGYQYQHGKLFMINPETITLSIDKKPEKLVCHADIGNR